MTNNTKTASLLLRVGLASVLIYAAIAATITPSHWLSFLPSMATKHIDAHTLLKMFSFYELALGLWLLSNWKLKWAAILTVLTMLGAIFSNIHAFETTFRDVAIAFAAAALYFLAD